MISVDWLLKSRAREEMPTTSRIQSSTRTTYHGTEAEGLETTVLTTHPPPTTIMGGMEIVRTIGSGSTVATGIIAPAALHATVRVKVMVKSIREFERRESLRSYWYVPFHLPSSHHFPSNEHTLIHQASNSNSIAISNFETCNISHGMDVYGGSLGDK
jgi:hypothetical protein